MYNKFCVYSIVCRIVTKKKKGSPTEDVAGDPPCNDENADCNDGRDAIENVIEFWESGS